MGIRGVSMITVQVRDFAGTLTWYRDVLGLAVVGHEPDVVFDAEEEGADEGYRLVRIRDPEGNPLGLTPSM